MARGDVDLDTEVQKLLAEDLGEGKRGGDLERARLQGDLQRGDEVPLGHPVDAPVVGLGGAAVDIDQLQGAAALGEYVGDRRPHPGRIDRQLGLASELGAVHEGPDPVGHVGVEGVAPPLQVAHEQQVLAVGGGRLDHGDGRVVVGLAQVEPHVEPAHPTPPKSGATLSVMALSITSVAKTWSTVSMKRHSYSWANHHGPKVARSSSRNEAGILGHSAAVTV